jgi:KilA domain-containing protein
MVTNKTIVVKGTKIAIFRQSEEDYISLTGIARHRDPERSDYILQNWLRNRSTIEFIGLWELLNNPGFNSIEFDGFKNQAGANSFSLTPKRWIEATHAIGIVSKAGKYGGTFAHMDIAFEFASWISAEFKLYLISEFKRLKKEEQSSLSLEWNLQRILTKINYRIHTDAIKENIIPALITKAQASFIYANEADMLNMALFGKTAQQWRNEHPGKEGNIRDYASLEQLVVLSNMESINAVMLHQGLPQIERIVQLNKIAISQLKSLAGNQQIKKLK